MSTPSSESDVGVVDNLTSPESPTTGESTWDTEERVDQIVMADDDECGEELRKVLESVDTVQMTRCKTTSKYACWLSIIGWITLKLLEYFTLVITITAVNGFSSTTLLIISTIMLSYACITILVGGTSALCIYCKGYRRPKKHLLP